MSAPLPGVCLFLVFERLLARAKTNRLGLWGLLYKIVQGDNYLVYSFVVFLDVKHKEFSQLGNLPICPCLGKHVMS